MALRDAAGPLLNARLGEGHQGGRYPQWCVRGRDAGMLEGCRRGHQGLGYGSSLIRTRRIVFTPTVALKDELANTAIQITCYDRNGEIVKRVTSADSGTVEDPEGDTTGDENTTGGNTSGGSTDNTGGNEGGGGSTIPGEGD